MAFGHIAMYVGFTEMIDDGLATFGFGFEETIGNRTVRCSGAGFQVVVDNVEMAAVISAVDGPMPVIEKYVIGEGEVSVHADAWVPAGVASPEIVMKSAV